MRGIYAYAMVLVFVLGLGIGYGVSVPSQRARISQAEELIRANRELTAELTASIEHSERIAERNRELASAQREAVGIIAETAVDLGRAAGYARSIADLIIPVYDTLGRIGDVIKVLGFSEYIFAEAGGEE